jgi:YegS/Rv2252/BmrU family lipid kinase
MSHNLTCELIINTGSKRSRALKQELLASLRRNGFTLTHINEINRKQTIEAIAGKVKERNPQLVLVGGGDGTISDTVDYLAGTETEVGIIPLGTTNNFARSLNIPLDIEGAVLAVKKYKARPVDLGSINGEYFSNVAGIGLSAKVAYSVTDASKRRWGRFAYALAGIKVLLTHKPFTVTIEDKDSELQLNFETHQVIIANGRYHAGKQIALDAKVDNRELLVFALGGRSKLSFMWSMFDFYVGKRKYVSHASYLIARHIRLSTSTTQIVELDGEVKFETPLMAHITPAAIKVRRKA